MFFGDDLFTPEYLAVVALTFAAPPLCRSAFSAAKQAPPTLHPFAWDAYLLVLGSRLRRRPAAVAAPPAGTGKTRDHPRTLLVLSPGVDRPPARGIRVDCALRSAHLRRRCCSHLSYSSST